MVDPLRSPSFFLPNEACALVFLTTFSATCLPLATTSSEVFLVDVVAFFALAFVAFAVVLAAAEALEDAAAAFFFTEEPAALTLDSTPATPRAALSTLVAELGERPAFLSAAGVDPATLATVPKFAAINFAAVAAPTPGKLPNPLFPVSFPAMCSPNWDRLGTIDECSSS